MCLDNLDFASMNFKKKSNNNSEFETKIDTTFVIIAIQKKKIFRFRTQIKH